MTKYIKAKKINGFPAFRAYSKPDLTKEEEMMEDQMRILRNSLYGSGLLGRTLDGDICLDPKFKKDLLNAVKDYGTHLEGVSETNTITSDT